MQGGVLPALLLSTFAGLSTTVGSLIALFSHRDDKRFLSLALGFSAGVMVMVSFAELLPEAGEKLNSVLGGYGLGAAALSLLCGVLLAFIIDAAVPDKKKKYVKVAGDGSVLSGSTSAQAMARMGAVTALAIAVHNFPEGIATFMAGYSDIRLGLPVAISIALHNIPEGVAVSVPVYYGTGSRARAFWYSALSGLTEPLGALLAFFVLAPFLNAVTLGAVFGTVSGIMIYIAFAELIPASERYGHPLAAATGIVAGAAFMLVALRFFGM